MQKLGEFLTISEIAKLTGLTVRTLHYYDEIGLLKPNMISESGYRFYSDKEIQLLHQILLLREVGFELVKIKEILSNKDFDFKHAYEVHKKLLLDKKARLENILDSIDETYNLIIDKQNIMKVQKTFKAFDDIDIEAHQSKYAKEVEEKYGNTDAYKQSQNRMAKYSKEDMAKILKKSGEIYQQIADNMDKSVFDKFIQDLVGQWQQHITSSFYDCTDEILSGLGKLYVEDERFTKNIDKIKPGLAKYLSKAIEVKVSR